MGTSPYIIISQEICFIKSTSATEVATTFLRLNCEDFKRLTKKRFLIRKQLEI